MLVPTKNLTYLVGKQIDELTFGSRIWIVNFRGGRFRDVLG